MNKNPVLDREFLEIRSLIVQLAAALDRVQRCPDSSKTDKRRGQIESAIRLVLHSDGNRAEQVQLLFSRDFDPDWKQSLLK